MKLYRVEADLLVVRNEIIVVCSNAVRLMEIVESNREGLLASEFDSYHRHEYDARRIEFYFGRWAFLNIHELSDVGDCAEFVDIIRTTHEDEVEYSRPFREWCEDHKLWIPKEYIEQWGVPQYMLGEVPDYVDDKFYMDTDHGKF